ncbi:c-type cytochrome [Sulfitobacter sp. JB4-11]|uniref:c-type cytochrome n=1 Tax=Sulfitobacter rhodophyticola TaxID=3238304 RepID=UPI0035181C9C
MKYLIPLIIACLPIGAQAQDAAEGEALYQTHCAACHGIEARGNGPMAPILTLQPPNLRTLTARYDGVFPVVRVVTRIDGRDPLVAHGSPMPVYGDFFEGDDTALKAETGQPIMTSRAIVDLVAYLNGVQE